MAYPFLPVNPCCTDVVINDPCGCSSTYTNSGCNNNNPCSTHLTASSTIVYDGPVLPCIVAEPCDTLNVILQKIDEIICNLVTQINYLSNQVTNITNQIIMINGDIINIYNTLGECCGATTTTTSTTTAAPCESFSLDNTGPDPVAIIITDCITGEQEAIVLLPGETDICVETDSPLTVPGTVIVTPNGPCGPTTTTTTTIVPTTTTTTTISPCECLTFYNGSIAIQEITYIDCNGDQQYDLINIGATNSYCGCCGEAPGSIDVTITIGANCVDGLCPAEPSTTTTTTTVACDCYDTEITITSEGLAITDDGQITVLYEDCLTNPYINAYTRPGVYSIGCVNYLVGITALGQVDGVESAIYVPITVGSPCCNATTTTTTTATPPTTTTTTTLPCNCVDIIISQADIDDATGNSFLNGFVNVDGTDGKKITCEGEDIVLHYNEAGTYSYCLKGEVIPTMSLYYLKDNNVITAIQSEIVNLETNCLVDGECIPTTTTTTTAYVLACTAGYTGPVGFPNRTTGIGSMTLGSGLVIDTTYTGPALITGPQPPYTNCVGGQFAGNVGIGGTISLGDNGLFTFVITYSVPQTAVKFVIDGIGYADQLGISEYYTITTDSTNTLVNLIAGCGDFRVEAPNVVAGSMSNPIDRIGGNVEVIADTPFTTVTITGNNSASLAGTGWDMYVCDDEVTTTTTTTTAEPTTTTTTTLSPA